jgi:hypothetical protein
MPKQKHTYDYHIDCHGNWFCEGNPVSDPDLFRMLSRSLFADRAYFFVRCEGEVHPVRVDDAPLLVRYVHVITDSSGELSSVEIELEDGRRESLNAETLQAEQDVLYCIATPRRLKAKLGKTAYYELTRYMHEDLESGELYFLIAGRKHAVYRTGGLRKN